MTIDFSTFSASDYAAWWGAIIASLALLWNVIVAVRAGAKMEISVTPNMEMYPPNPGQEGKTYIFLKAVNTGTSPTTITHFHGYQANSRMEYFRKKHRPFIVGNNGYYKQLPVKLGPGEEWMGIVEQDEEFINGELLYIGIIHNQKKKPIFKQVKLST
jgi:hypothetical protein